jgi:hypothetical protein
MSLMVVVGVEVAVEFDGGFDAVVVAGVSIGKSRRLVANHWIESTRSGVDELEAVALSQRHATGCVRPG